MIARINIRRIPQETPNAKEPINQIPSSDGMKYPTDRAWTGLRFYDSEICSPCAIYSRISFIVLTTESATNRKN